MIEEIRRAAKKRILYLPHAFRQMLRPARMISAERQVIHNGSMVENYPDDPRGRSCLMLGFDAEGRPIHVVCAPREDYVGVITAYIPEAGEWSDDYTKRMKP